MNSSEKPRILVTGPAKRLRFGWWTTRFLLFLSGAKAHYVSPGKTFIPHNVAGVVIGGGDDIEPTHYGLEHDEHASYDAERDRIEMLIIRQAIASHVPIFGICRGMQLINVVLGGSLHLSIRAMRKHTSNKSTIFATKQVDIKKDTLLENIVGSSSIPVNSLHYQAIDRIAEGLQVSAKDRDHFIQAIEQNSPAQIIGVQWHPEYMLFSSTQRSLFSHFVSRVKKSKKTLPSVIGL